MWKCDPGVRTERHRRRGSCLLTRDDRQRGTPAPELGSDGQRTDTAASGRRGAPQTAHPRPGRAPQPEPGQREPSGDPSREGGGEGTRGWGTGRHTRTTCGLQALFSGQRGAPAVREGAGTGRPDVFLEATLGALRTVSQRGTGCGQGAPLSWEALHTTGTDAVRAQASWGATGASPAPGGTHRSHTQRG